MTFSQINRRLHLYLGLALLPWLFMYAISSAVFAHAQFFEQRDAARNLPAWTLRAVRSLDVRVPDDSAELRTFGARMLADAGIEGTNFGVYRQGPTQVNVYSYSFWRSTQLKYFIDQKRMTVEDRRFRWDQFLTGMHSQGGFEREGVLATAWSVAIDLFCVALLAWTASGLYMWWSLQGHRRWGWLAILAGAISFGVFTLGL